MVALSYVKDRDRWRRGERDGRATALAFAAAGARVAGADVEEPGAKAVAAEIDAGGGQALPVALDVADSDRAARVLEMDEAAWDRVIRVNLTGAFLMAKAALPAMIARGGGSIVMVASQLGRVASPGGPAYCATKGRADPAGQGLAADHAAQGIRANTISPAAIETRRMLRRWKDASSFMTGCDLLIDGGYTAV
jgi:NAD(P)-dependent dehydrogenase (short-subunit alcohol dehydrogenase family)